MQRQLAWAMGNRERRTRCSPMHSDTQAYSGHLRKHGNFRGRRRRGQAQRPERDGGIVVAKRSFARGRVGKPAQAREQAAALALASSRDLQITGSTGAGAGGRHVRAQTMATT